MSGKHPRQTACYVLWTVACVSRGTINTQHCRNNTSYRSLFKFTTRQQNYSNSHAKGSSTSHIMGGSSSSSIQKGFFGGCALTTSPLLSSALCLSRAALLLQASGAVAAGVAEEGRGLSDGEIRGSLSSGTDVWGTALSTVGLLASLSLASSLSLTKAHFLVWEIEGGAWGPAAVVTMLLWSQWQGQDYSKCQSTLHHRRLHICGIYIQSLCIMVYSMDM